MKSTKITYWICTSLIVAFEGVIPAFTFNTPIARQSMLHLGYPDHFRVELTVFKVLGAILLIFPQFPRRWKEWAYAGFTFDFIAASVAHGAIDGLGDFQTWFPLVVLGILMTSYVCYNRLSIGRKSQPSQALQEALA